MGYESRWFIGFMPWFIPWFYRFAKVVCDLGMPFWLVQLVIFWVQCTQRQWPTPGKAAHKINNFHQVFNSSFLDETKNILPMVQPLWDFHQITLHALTYHKNYISNPPQKKTQSLSKKHKISRWLYVTCYPSPVVSIGLMPLALFHVLGPQILRVIHLRLGGRKVGLKWV